MRRCDDIKSVLSRRRRAKRPRHQWPRSAPPADAASEGEPLTVARAPASNVDGEEQRAGSRDDADETDSAMAASTRRVRRRQRVHSPLRALLEAEAAAAPPREVAAAAPAAAALPAGRYRTGLRWLEDGGPFPILDPDVDHLAPGATHLVIKNTRFPDLPPVSIAHVRRLAASRQECGLWSEQEVEAVFAYISPEPPRFLTQSELCDLLPGQRPAPPPLTALYRHDIMMQVAAEERAVLEEVRALFRVDAPDAAPVAAAAPAPQPPAKRRRRAAPQEPLFVRADAPPAGTPLRDKCARLEQLRALATARAPKGDPFGGTRLRRPRWERLVEAYQHQINPQFRPGEDRLVFKMTPDVLTRCWEQADADIKAAQEAYDRDPRVIDARLSEADLLLFELDPSARGEWEREQEAWYASKMPQPATPAWDFQEYWARTRAQAEACKRRVAPTPAELAHARDFPPPPIRPRAAAPVFVPPASAAAASNAASSSSL